MANKNKSDKPYKSIVQIDEPLSDSTDNKNDKNADILQELALIRKGKNAGSSRNLKSSSSNKFNNKPSPDKPSFDKLGLNDNSDASSKFQTRSLDSIIDELNIKELFSKKSFPENLSNTNSHTRDNNKSQKAPQETSQKNLPKSNWLDLDDEVDNNNNNNNSNSVVDAETTKPTITPTNSTKSVKSVKTTTKIEKSNNNDNSDSNDNSIKLADVNLNAGHRERLRKKLLKHTDSLYDYEVLELLLSYVVKRRDVKSVAKRVLNEIGGDFSKFKELDVVRLNSIDGVGDGISSFIFLLQEFSRRISISQIRTDTVKSFDLFDEPSVVVETLRLAIGSFNVESAYICLYDKNREMLEFERLELGSSYEVRIDLKHIVHRCMDSRVKFVMLIHTHIEANDIKPSFADKEITRNLEYLLHSIDVTLYDHYIVTEGGLFSFRSNSLIRF